MLVENLIDIRINTHKLAWRFGCDLTLTESLNIQRHHTSQRYVMRDKRSDRSETEASLSLPVAVTSLLSATICMYYLRAYRACLRACIRVYA